MNKTLKYLKTRFRRLSRGSGETKIEEADKNRGNNKLLLSAMSSSATLTNSDVVKREKVNRNSTSSEELLQIWENQRSGYKLKERDSLCYGDVMIYCV